MKFWAVSRSTGNWTTILYLKKSPSQKLFWRIKHHACFAMSFLYFISFIHLALFALCFFICSLVLFCFFGGKGVKSGQLLSVKPATQAYSPPISFPNAVILLFGTKYNVPLDQGNEYSGGVIDRLRHFSLLRTSRLLFVISYFQLTWRSLVR